MTGWRRVNIACSGCVAIHRRTAFSCEELDKKVDLKADYVSRVEQDLCRAATYARFCLATRVSIRFGFAHTMTFLDLRNEVSSWAWCQYGGRFCLLWCLVDSKESVRGIVRCGFNRTRVGGWIPIAKQDTSCFGNLVPYLQSINFALCPHTCLADQAVIELFGKRQWWRRAPGCSLSIHCKHCKTKIFLHSGQNLYIERNVGRLRSPLDPTWLGQHSVSGEDRNLLPYCTLLEEWLQHPHDTDGEQRLRLSEADIPRPDFAALFGTVRGREPEGCFGGQEKRLTIDLKERLVCICLEHQSLYNAILCKGEG